jgi:hypothetical protein
MTAEVEKLIKEDLQRRFPGEYQVNKTPPPQAYSWAREPGRPGEEKDEEYIGYGDVIIDVGGRKPSTRNTKTPGLLNMNEPKDQGMLEDPVYRHYARIAAWEMPLLAQFVKKFEPPKADEVLRWRYTTYMGEQHLAEKKVVVEFSPADLDELTDGQRLKLKKLAGPRYNPETDIIKMSCENYENQAQNKRYLGDLINSMIKEAKVGTTITVIRRKILTVAER